MGKQMKTPRGTARKLRRSDMHRFQAERRARLAALTGTVKVNAPSLQMLGQYIGKVPA